MTIAFTKVSLPGGWLGNMAAFPVEHDGKVWRTTEALFQALRFDDEAIREEIRAQKSPMAAKMTAKRHADKMTVAPMSEQDVANMKFCLCLKLLSHKELMDKLHETGDELIVEDVTKRGPGERHRFWGAALINGEWVGENKLGKLWMELREAFKAPAPHPEQEADEIFLMNVSEEEFRRYEAERLGMKALRLGQTAYETNSTTVVPEYRPMFGVKA